MTYSVVKLHAVFGGVTGHIVMRRHIAEIRRVGSRTYISRNRGLVDADYIPPTFFNQVMHDRGTDDTALADDDNICTTRKIGHGLRLRELLFRLR